MTRAPWVTHFGFTRTPFSKNIPAKDLLERASHQEAVARIRFCIAESMLGVITGGVGVGKTVAVRAAVSQLDQAAHHIVYLANPTVGTRGLYVTIVRALGAVPHGFKADLIAQAQDLLAAEEHERRRRVVLLVDEAHLLEPQQLEELRLLTSAEMDAHSPLALLLVGQPTLARQLRMAVFAALDQRVATRYQIAPMDLAESAKYLSCVHVYSTDYQEPSTVFALVSFARGLLVTRLGRGTDKLSAKRLYAGGVDGRSGIHHARRCHAQHQYDPAAQ